jgi:hypothetical protein
MAPGIKALNDAAYEIDNAGRRNNPLRAIERKLGLELQEHSKSLHPDHLFFALFLPPSIQFADEEGA